LSTPNDFEVIRTQANLCRFMACSRAVLLGYISEGAPISGQGRAMVAEGWHLSQWFRRRCDKQVGLQEVIDGAAERGRSGRGKRKPSVDAP